MMSSPFVSFSADPEDPQIKIVGEEEEVIEWSEDFMTPLATRRIARAVVVLNGEEVYFFAFKASGIFWICQRQDGNAPQIAEQLNNMGIPAHIIE